MASMKCLRSASPISIVIASDMGETPGEIDWRDWPAGVGGVNVESRFGIRDSGFAKRERIPLVVPADAGIQCPHGDVDERRWVPAFAGTTNCEFRRPSVLNPQRPQRMLTRPA